MDLTFFNHDVKVVDQFENFIHLYNEQKKIGGCRNTGQDYLNMIRIFAERNSFTKEAWYQKNYKSHQINQNKQIVEFYWVLLI